MAYDGDRRWNELASVLVDYSTETKAGDRVLIIMREVESFPLARAVHRRAIEVGAFPQTLFYSAFFQRDLMSRGSSRQIEWVPELQEKAMRWADVCIDLRGARNLHEFGDIPPDTLSAHRRAEGEISALRTRTTRWVLCRIPNEAFAQQAGVSLESVFDVFFASTILDWQAESAELHSRAERLSGARSVRITGSGTDLSFSVEGRTFAADDGHINMPGGEIYTSPIEDSAEGHISFDEAAVFAGRLIAGLTLTFRSGRVVEAQADTNESFLHSLLDMDAGSRRIGEFGIGTNHGLPFMTSDILYDEKVYGTVHIALGRSYEVCGGRNESALHWDIIKDLRAEGELRIDGEAVLRDGELHI